MGLPAGQRAPAWRWSAPREPGRGRARRRRWARAALTILTVAALVAGIAIAGLLAAAPSVDDAPARVDEVLARHGGRRVSIGRDARLSRAIVAVEDHRFFAHEGVDPLAFARVGLRSLTDPGGDAGGSTIAMQLAKLLYTGAASDPAGAVTQVGVALDLERSYSKDELLDLYLNAAYFGDGQYGADQASRHFTGHAVGDLTWGEASLLAGLVQAPSRYTRDLTAARRRQRHVLDRLVATGALSSAEAGAAFREPLPRFHRLAG